MKKNLKFLSVFFLCLIFLCINIAKAESSMDLLLKILIKKGILTEKEAEEIIKEVKKEEIKKKKKEEKIEKLEEKETVKKLTKEIEEIKKTVKPLKGVKLGFLWYISYQNGEKDDKDYSQVVLKRGYLTVKKKFNKWFSARLTYDITTIKDPGAGESDPFNLSGSIVGRIKYLYAKFNLPDFIIFTKPYIEIGQVHIPWLDYEEHTNFYRCQDTMFLERNHIFNSADRGITFVSLLGGEIDEDYQKRVNSHYPGRYGSIALGIYNGGGYHANEKNNNKVIEGRITIRPLPDILPGLQFSYLGLYGRGNTEEKPLWRVNLGFLSYEHEYFTFTAQYYDGKGLQSGKDENDKDGYSFFLEIKPNRKISLIGRYDYFDPNDKQNNDENERYIVGIAYHFYKQHKNMFLVDYERLDYEDSTKEDENRLQFTIQVKF